MAGFYDGRNYHFCDSIDALLNRILAKRNRDRIIFAHNGGRFDFLFLFDALTKKNKKVSLITQGPRVTALKIEITKPTKRWDKKKHKWVWSGAHYITLQDSVALLPRKLEQLCETFKPEHMKMTGAIDFEKEKVSKDNELHRQYLEADCKCLWEILDKYRQLPYIRDVGFKMTLASTALAAWRTTLKEKIRTTPDDIQEFVRHSYAGGRCEIFRQVMPKGACYDVNSLYPTMMLKPLPVEYICESRDPFEFGFHDVTVEVPETYMPILWVKTPKLIFPTGRFRGVYFSEELKLAVEQGARIIKHHKGYHFSERSDLFTDYINDCYQLRLDNPGTDLDFLGKNLMTNTYGKFAERETKEILMRVDPKDADSWPKAFKYFISEQMFNKRGFIKIEHYNRSPHMLCHIASAITAWGRIHMARNIYLPRQDSIYYTDTDSGFITGELPSGKNLGELKKEYDIKSGFFLLPKGYYLELDPRDAKSIEKHGPVIKKLKGFSKKSLELITKEMFKKGNISGTEEKLATFRTALIRENTFLTVTEIKKSVINPYNKRKLEKGGNTRPWHYEKGALV